MKDGWKYKKLGEVCDFFRGLSYSKKDEVEESSNKVLRSNNIDLLSHTLIFDDVKCVKEDLVIADEKKIKKNSILICMSNGSYAHLGKVAFVPQNMDYAFGGFMGLICPQSNVVYPKYCFYACFSNRFLAFLRKLGNGANIKNLKWSDLQYFSIPFPPLSEQLAIVEELDLLNAIIDKKKAELEELDKLAQSIFYDMFGDPVENDKGWEVKKLEEFSKIITGNTPSRKVAEFYNDNFIEWIKSDNISDEILNPAKAKESLSESGAEKGRIAHAGDILVTCIAGSLSSIGTSCVLNRSVAFNQQINAITKLKKAESLFLRYIIKFSKKYFQEFATTGMKHIITKGVFEKIPVILPPLPLQQQFASRISALEKMKEKVTESMTETQTLLAATMDKYFG